MSDTLEYFIHSNFNHFTYNIEKILEVSREDKNVIPLKFEKTPDFVYDIKIHDESKEIEEAILCLDKAGNTIISKGIKDKNGGTFMFPEIDIDHPYPVRILIYMELFVLIKTGNEECEKPFKISYKSIYVDDSTFMKKMCNSNFIYLDRFYIEAGFMSPLIEYGKSFKRYIFNKWSSEKKEKYVNTAINDHWELRKIREEKYDKYSDIDKITGLFKKLNSDSEKLEDRDIKDILKFLIKNN